MFSWWGTSEKSDNEGKEAVDDGESSSESKSAVTTENVEQKDVSETAKDIAKNFGSKLRYMLGIWRYFVMK